MSSLFRLPITYQIKHELLSTTFKALYNLQPPFLLAN